MAGAGSGKTRTVVRAYLGLRKKMCVHRIVADNFTRKSAREMRNRVRREISVYLQRSDLDEKTRHTWQARYEELNAARISTIHSLCAEILRAHPAEAGIDPFFEALTEGEQSRIISEIAQQTLAWGGRRGSRVLIQAFTLPCRRYSGRCTYNDGWMSPNRWRAGPRSLASLSRKRWPGSREIGAHEITAAWVHLFDLETSGS